MNIQRDMFSEEEFYNLREFQTLGLSSSSGNLSGLENDTMQKQTTVDDYFDGMEEMFFEREQGIEVLKGFGNYHYRTEKFSEFEGVWKGITAERIGDKSTGIEVFTVVKQIGEKKLIVRKDKVDGKDVNVKTYAEGMEGEKEVQIFQRDWIDFSIDKNFAPMTPKTPMPPSQMSKLFDDEILRMSSNKEKMEKLGIIRTKSPDPISRLTGIDPKKSFTEEGEKIGRCYVSSYKSVTMGKNNRSIMTRKDRDSEGNETTTVEKGLDEKRIAYIKSKDRSGEVRNEKKFEKVEPKEEGEFLKNWDGFAKKCEKNDVLEKVYMCGRSKTPKIIIV